MTRALQARTYLALSDAKRVTDRVLDGHVMDIECPTGAECRVLADELRSLGADVTVGPENPALLHTPSAVFGALRDAILPSAEAAGFPRTEERYSPFSMGGRWITWAASVSVALRLTWEPRDRWFVLEASTGVTPDGDRVWEDLTLQRLDPSTVNEQYVRELLEDIVPMAEDFLWFGH
jgi:hypothetical protein